MKFYHLVDATLKNQACSTNVDTGYLHDVARHLINLYTIEKGLAELPYREMGYIRCLLYSTMRKELERIFDVRLPE